MQRRELDEARRLFDESLRLDQEAGERVFFRGEYERHIAFVDLFEERPTDAVPHLERSLEARQAAGAIDAGVFAAATLASTLLDLNRGEEAQRAVEFGLQASRGLDFPRGGASMELAAGRYYLVVGDVDAARTAFENAIRHAEAASLTAMAAEAEDALQALNAARDDG
jgi:tetratricopeptide (TPR) repeat protein